jgi:putative oxidoreductase
MYAVFRILVGFLFFQHGAQKLFGWFGGKAVTDLSSLMGVAGIIEVVGGILIIFGLFTRYAAVIVALEMLVAYVMFHYPNGWSPIENKGELALLYFAVALVLLSQGSRAWSLERAVFKKEH